MRSGIQGWMVVFAVLNGAAAADRERVTFVRGDDSLQIALGGQVIAEYVAHDDQVRRPYFRHLKTPSGRPITRQHPPMPGQDLDDHPTMHPGLWLAFGDTSGGDFWRNKGTVRHMSYLQEPQTTSSGGRFAVRKAYLSRHQTVCTEDCTITVSATSDGWQLDWDSVFRPEGSAFWFGDQEEMGLGVRVATPLAVVKGGEIVNSDGRKNGAQAWGRQADWCRYGGVIEGRNVGVALLPHPQNFRRSWFHARDYGLLVANPFGQNAFTKGDNSRVTVAVGELFRLRFCVWIYDLPPDGTPAIDAAFRAYSATE